MRRAWGARAGPAEPQEEGGGGVSAGGGTGAALGVLGSALQKCVAFWVPSLAFNNRALLPAA